MNSTLNLLSLRANDMHYDPEVQSLKKTLDAFLLYPSIENGKRFSSFITTDINNQNYNLLYRIFFNPFNSYMDKKCLELINELNNEKTAYINSFVYKGLSNSDFQTLKLIFIELTNILAIGLACLFLASPALPIIAYLFSVRTLTFLAKSDYSKANLKNGIKAIGNIILEVISTPIKIIFSPFLGAKLIYKFLTSSKDKDRIATENNYDYDCKYFPSNFPGSDSDSEDDSEDIKIYDLHNFNFNEFKNKYKVPNCYLSDEEETRSVFVEDEPINNYRNIFKQRLPLHSIYNQTYIVEPGSASSHGPSIVQ